MPEGKIYLIFILILKLVPVIRFLREGRDVECPVGSNLREVALNAGIELYGVKGKLLNCGGYGQCITCFVAVVGSNSSEPFSPLTALEIKKLKQQGENWRLACQCLVKSSAIVLTRPQQTFNNLKISLEEALKLPLPK